MADESDSTIGDTGAEDGSASERPLIGVSACLLGDAVRYDGGHRTSAAVAHALARHVRFVRICPEVGIGLGTPRETIHLVHTPEGRRLRATGNGTDHTNAMRRWAIRKARELSAAGIRGFVLKARSPSCGLSVPLHDEDGSEIPGAGAAGAFVQTLLEHLPGLPVVEEDDLENEAGRRRFLYRVRAYGGGGL